MKKINIKLVIGLGNPGKQYQNTWHNLGFLTVEALQQRFSFSNFKKSAKFQAEISEGRIGQERIIVVKPTTFMNNSGQSVAAILKYYKLNPADIFVVHDDIDLPLGNIRLAKNSSAGGHNGVKSIIEHLGTKNFLQLKIGVATALLERLDSADYVLEKFSKKQAQEISVITKTATSALEVAINESVERAMNQFN